MASITGYTQERLRAALTIEEVAELLGVSERTIRRRVQDETIRSTRLGRLIRIPASEVRKIVGAG